MILSAQSIRRRCLESGLVTPFYERTEVEIDGRRFTHGLSAAGYDVRLDMPQEEMALQPGEFILVATVERFNMPRDLIGIVHDKSSWARRGLAVQNTVIEPGWRGYLTLELTNHSPEPIMLYRGVGIAQVVFHLLDAPTDEPYRGKYQDQQRGPQGAR